MQYNPASYACYKKPNNAGKKGKAGEKRRARQVSPELFTDRIANTPKPPKLITPLKVRKSNDSWRVKTPDRADPNADIFNADRKQQNNFLLVHKGDKKSFPATVQRCQECRQSFTDADLVAVKTTAPREFTDPQGKKRKVVSNIYLHYLTLPA